MKTLHTLFGALAMTTVLLFSSIAFAANDHNTSAQGGYTGPGLSPITVQQAKELKDDAPVVLRGYIIQSLGDEDYLFKDDTGTINVEIDHKVWQGRQVSEKDLVEISGEVDKDWGKVEIEVKRITTP